MLTDFLNSLTFRLVTKFVVVIIKDPTTP